MIFFILHNYVLDSSDFLIDFIVSVEYKGMYPIYRFCMQVWENQRKQVIKYICKILLQSKCFDLSNENDICISHKNNVVHSM